MSAQDETTPPSIDEIITSFNEALKFVTPGVWSKGDSTHQTVSKREGQEPYRIADFRHADDASFCDLAHAYVPAMIKEIEDLREKNKALTAIANAKGYSLIAPMTE